MRIRGILAAQLAACLLLGLADYGGGVSFNEQPDGRIALRGAGGWVQASPCSPIGTVQFVLVENYRLAPRLVVWFRVKRSWHGPYIKVSSREIEATGPDGAGGLTTWVQWP